MSNVRLRLRDIGLKEQERPELYVKFFYITKIKLDGPFIGKLLQVTVSCHHYLQVFPVGEKEGMTKVPPSM